MFCGTPYSLLHLIVFTSTFISGSPSFLLTSLSSLIFFSICCCERLTGLSFCSWATSENFLFSSSFYFASCLRLSAISSFVDFLPCFSASICSGVKCDLAKPPDCGLKIPSDTPSQIRTLPGTIVSQASAPADMKLDVYLGALII